MMYKPDDYVNLQKRFEFIENENKSMALKIRVLEIENARLARAYNSGVIKQAAVEACKELGMAKDMKEIKKFN